MDRAVPPSDGPTLLDDAVDESPEPVTVPPVVAVVVTRDAGPWLEECLDAFGAADYPALTVLVLDAGSAEDPTPRVAKVLPSAFVKRIEGDVGFAVAANHALEMVAGATFLLLCHDDVVLDPAAPRLLVEEAYRSNAAIVGPKLVDYDRPDVLLEVGLSIDRFAVPHSDIEPGEIDQEQHDAVRDVFYVPSAAMLVRADLFSELGGFDPETSPGGEDLDLCWRARLAGARVMVAPDARARHRQAAELRGEGEPVLQEVLQHNRLRAMLKSSSGHWLLILVPVALLLNTLESIALFCTRRRDRAKALMGGWIHVARNLGELRASRKATQALRQVPDSELHALQVRGSARVRGYVVGSLHAEDRIRALGDRSRTVADSASTGVRSPMILAVLVFVFIGLVGSRGLVMGGVSAVGQLPVWPSVSDFLQTFTSHWRYSGLGSSLPPPSALVLGSVLGSALLGATSMARTILVVGAVPLGVFGAWRLSGRISRRGWPVAATALVYGVNPLPRNALAAGRLGPLVLFALAPFILSGLLRLAGYCDDPYARRWRGRVGTGALVAIAGAAWPLALALPLVVVVALALAAPFARDSFRKVRSLVGAAIMVTGVALLLLMPWPLGYLASGDRVSALGIVFRPIDDVGTLLRFDTGPNGAGGVGWVLLLAAFLVLVLGSGDRLAWAARAWMLALVSFALAWLPSQLASAVTPAVEGVLVPAALGLALAVGLGVEAFLEDVRLGHFGWRQVLSIVGAAALAVSAFGFVADAVGGRWHQPASDWTETLSWMRAQQDAGQFRVLWLGDAEVLPGDPIRTGEVTYALTNDGPGDARAMLPPPPGGASARVGQAVDLLENGTSSRVGRLLGPMAVRYIAVPERPDTGAVALDPAPPALKAGLAAQIDLIRLEAPPGLELYENRAWVPGLAVGTEKQLAGEVTSTLLPGAAGTARPVTNGSTAPAGTILWSEAYDGAWHATSNGKTLVHQRAPGARWANAYRHPVAGSVSINDSQQWFRYPVVLLELVLVLGALMLWRGTMRVRRRRPSEPSAGEVT